MSANMFKLRAAPREVQTDVTMATTGKHLRWQRHCFAKHSGGNLMFVTSACYGGGAAAWLEPPLPALRTACSIPLSGLAMLQLEISSPCLLFAVFVCPRLSVSVCLAHSRTSQTMPDEHLLCGNCHCLAIGVSSACERKVAVIAKACQFELQNNSFSNSRNELRVKMEWCREKVICLIRLFEERPCLWDKTHKFYRDRDAKNAAMLEISEKLGLSCVEVERKLNTLLTQYRREKHVQRKMESAGCMVKKPWFGYNLLKFLESTDSKYFHKWAINKTDVDVIHRVLFNPEALNVAVNHQSSQEEDSLPNATEPEVIAEPCLSKTLTQSPRTRDLRERKRNSDKTHIKINQAFRILKTAFKQSQQRDDLKIFAEGVESRLRKVKDKRKVCILKHQIETLLFTVEMEELAQATVSMSPQHGSEAFGGSHKTRTVFNSEEHTKSF